MHKYYTSAYGLAWAAIVIAGCTDTRGRFDEFIGRTPDGGRLAIDARPIEELPDISGTFLLSVAPSVAPELPVQFRTQVQFTKNDDGTGTVSGTIQALSSMTREPVGDSYPAAPTQVAKDGTFTTSVVDLVLPGPANPLTGSMLTATIVLEAQIRSADRFCGTLAQGSKVSRPTNIDLAGSTFSAIRISPDVPASELPPPETECPAELPDAGVDAMPVDAGADAPGVDAQDQDAQDQDAM